jgi:DNA-binding IclR family transcriptional regulator
VARCVFLELAALYNGGNNGFLALSARDAAERVGCSKNTAGRAIAELCQKGFVEVAQRGHFDRKSRHASEYRLTLYECHKTGQRASRPFMSVRSEAPLKSIAGPCGDTDGPTRGTPTRSAQ